MRSRLIDLIAVVAALHALASEPLSARTLTVGSITDKAAQEFRTWNPFIRYLARQLASDDIEDGKLVTARDSLEMARYLREGSVDLFIDSPLVALGVSRASGSILFMRRWKDGVAEYQSVIFTRADSPLQRAADLAGRKIAFKSADSTSSYVVPRLWIERAQLRLIGLENHRALAPAGQVGFIFSGSDENGLFQVLAGHVEASAMGSHELMRLAPAGAIKVIAQSEPLPRQLVSHRGGLPAPLVARIRAVLIGMEQTEEGRNILAAFEKTTRFDDLAPESLDRIRAIADGPMERASTQ